jgi:PAS domain S-box-containing protein
LDLQATLGEMGYAIAAAVASGEDAVAQTAALHPDLVLMDIKLKGAMDGVKAAERITAQFHIPVIFLTAHADLSTFRQAVATKPFGFVLKPYTEQDLRTAIEVSLARHEVERIAREHKQWLAAVVRGIGDAVLAANLDGAITLLNPEAERLTGWRHPQAEGRAVAEVVRLIHEQTGQDLAPSVESVLATGQETSLPAWAVMVSRTGLKTPIEGRASPIRMADGSLIGAVMTFRDITRRRRTEARLRSAEKMDAVKTLTACVAHDFNNVLTAIMGRAELLTSRTRPGDPGYDHTAGIMEAAERAKDLVQRMLALGRPAEGARTPVSLGHIVQEAVQSLRATAPPQIEIRAVLRTSSDIVSADAFQLHQIVTSLCANAIEAVQETGGTVTVTVEDASGDQEPDAAPPARRADDDVVRLSVRDTGIGIEPEYLDRIFDPFFTTKPLGKGAGVGLTMVHGIVTALNGSVHVESHPGRGSVFTVLLPKGQAERPSFAAPPQRQASGTARPRVLVVDDQTEVRNVLASALEFLGYLVVACANGIEALETFRRAPTGFNLVLTDQTMPGMTGDQLVRAIHALRPDQPIILCTGFSDVMMNEAQARKAGACGFLMKPIGLEALARAVRSALQKQA